MPTIWGILERVEINETPNRGIQIRTLLPGGVTIRIRALIERQTTVARGVERVDLSNLKEGEFVEVTYRHGDGGFMEAETVYVHPGDVTG